MEEEHKSILRKREVKKKEDERESEESVEREREGGREQSVTWPGGKAGVRGTSGGKAAEGRRQKAKRDPRGQGTSLTRGRGRGRAREETRTGERTLSEPELLTLKISNPNIRGSPGSRAGQPGLACPMSRAHTKLESAFEISQEENKRATSLALCTFSPPSLPFPGTLYSPRVL